GGERFLPAQRTGWGIGESWQSGHEVTIYQGVTLGALNFPRDTEGRVIKGRKRHPDIESGVVIYSGATILGPVRIGAGSVVGGNVWLTQSVPPKTRIVASTPQLMHVDQPVPDYQI